MCLHWHALVGPLDRNLEHSVRQAINLRLADRTVLLITHRLETVIDADHVIYIEAGRVRLEGPPTELLKDSENSFSKAFRIAGVPKTARSRGPTARTAASADRARGKSPT